MKDYLKSQKYILITSVILLVIGSFSLQGFMSRLQLPYDNKKDIEAVQEKDTVQDNQIKYLFRTKASKEDMKEKASKEEVKSINEKFDMFLEWYKEDRKNFNK